MLNIAFFQDVINFLMSRENIMPRLNQKILSISDSKVSEWVSECIYLIVDNDIAFWKYVTGIVRIFVHKFYNSFSYFFPNISKYNIYPHINPYMA